LFSCASPIHQVKTTEEHTKTISENVDTILSFLSANYEKIKNCNKRNIEEYLGTDLIGFFRTTNESEKLQEIKTKLSNDENYLKYKTFVGYDSEGIEKNRRKQIENCVAQITEDNLDEWKNYLVKEILNDYNDQNQGEYHNVHYFLQMLATKKPDDGKKLLGVPELSKFNIALLIGLLASNKKSQTKEDIKTKIEEGKSLSEIASAFFSVKDIDEEPISKLAHKILKNDDIPPIIEILHTVCRQYPTNKNLKWIFIKIIEKFTDLSFYEWPQRISYLTEEITKDLSAEEYEIILNNLIMKKR